MKTIPSSVTRIGAIASGQLKRVYQGRSTAAPLRRGGERPAYVAGAVVVPATRLRRGGRGPSACVAFVAAATGTGSGSTAGGGGPGGGGAGRERSERIGMFASIATCFSRCSKVTSQFATSTSQ